MCIYITVRKCSTEEAELLTSLSLILPCRNQSTAPASGNSVTTFSVKTTTKSADAPFSV